MTKAVISFVTQEEAANIRIISDDERNLDSLGSVKTSFIFGDTAYFRVYSDDPDRVFAVTTDGTLTSLGTFSEDVSDEIISFVTDTSATPDKPVTSISSYEWLGTSLGGIQKDGLFSLSVSSVSPADGLIGTAAVSYRTVYRLFGLKLAKKTRSTYPVTVYAGVVNV